MGFELKAEENEEICRSIHESGATVVVVGVGCPKQEKWIYTYKDSLPGVRLWMALGATIDFEAGNERRAPRLVQRLCLEWFYRFLQAPRKRFRRYFIDDPKRNEIIVFRYPKDESRDFIKRVIAVGGDTMGLQIPATGIGR